MRSAEVEPRATIWLPIGCSCAEIGPCSEGGTGPVPLGCAPRSPWGRRQTGVEGFAQSTIIIDWPWRHGFAGAPLLPGRYAMPVEHSHQSLCVLGRLRIEPAKVGFDTSVTSQTSYPEALLPWTLRIR